MARPASHGRAEVTTPTALAELAALLPGLTAPATAGAAATPGLLPHPGLLALAFCAGLVDSAVGGGGLIQIPALLLFCPGVPVPTVLGTNKAAGIAGTSVAAVQYARRTRIPWKTLLPGAFTALVFSLLGARTVSRLDPALLRPLMLGLLVVMAIYTFARRGFGETHAPRFAGRTQALLLLLTGAVLGFYDGFFGPGTGSLLLFVYITLFGFDFLTAAAGAKVSNVATNVSAVAYFVATGHVLWALALPMAACNIAGSLTGARLAMGKGRPYIRILFLLVLAALIVKLGLDLRKH